MVSDFIRDLTLRFVCAGARAPSSSGNCCVLFRALSRGRPRTASAFPGLTRLEQMWCACAPRRARVSRAQTYRTNKRHLHRGAMRILSCVRRKCSTTGRCVTLIGGVSQERGVVYVVNRSPVSCSVPHCHYFASLVCRQDSGGHLHHGARHGDPLDHWTNNACRRTPQKHRDFPARSQPRGQSHLPVCKRG